MADFNCKDINGLDISQFVFNEDGTVSGIISTGSTTTDPNDNPSTTTYGTRGASVTTDSGRDIIVLGGGLDTSGGDGRTNPNESLEADDTSGDGKTNPNDLADTIDTSGDDEVVVGFTQSSGTNLSPVSEACCNALNFNWDISTSTCFWTAVGEESPDFKIVLGAKGNDGAWFQIDENESCHMEVEFDYLFHFDCDTIQECLSDTISDDSNTTDLENLIGEIESDCETQIQSLEELNIQLQAQMNLCNSITIQFNSLILEKQNECTNYQKNIDNFEALIRSSKDKKEIIALQSQLDYYTTLLNRCIAEAKALNSEKQTEEFECQNQISIVEGTISKLEISLAECQKEIAGLGTQLEVALSEPRATNNGVVNCLSVFSDLSVCVTLDKVDTRNSDGQSSYVDPTTLTTVFEEQLFEITDIVEYFRGNCNTGLLVTGSSICMEQFEQCVIFNLSGNCGVYSACTLDSNWLHHKFVISDEATLSLLKNEKVKLGFNIKNCECDFSILIDRIEINKVCTTTDREDIYVSKCPSFEIERVCDNKKSWVAEEVNQDREFFFPMRETDYDINHHKLAINTKEIDLDISPANAIETDVWCYIRDNEAILDISTGTTGTTTGCTTGCTLVGDVNLDINELLTTEVSAMTTVKEFTNTLCSELIDVKNRKTISSYPTLRAVYERYVSSYQGSPQSSAFNYNKIGNFISLIGDYWVDLIEQVIPSTTIWGSTIKYSNTIFDKDKFKYKQYSLFTCQNVNGVQYPSPTSGYSSNVEVITMDIGIPAYIGPDCLAPEGEITVCSGVSINQINCGSEFIGSVTIIGGGGGSGTNTPNPTGTTGDEPIEISECDLIINSLNVNVGKGGLTATPNFVGGAAPYTFNWTIALQTGQFSTFAFDGGDNTTEVPNFIGPALGILGDGDKICLSLTIEDINGCTYGLSQCYPSI